MIINESVIELLTPVERFIISNKTKSLEKVSYLEFLMLSVDISRWWLQNAPFFCQGLSLSLSNQGFIDVPKNELGEYYWDLKVHILSPLPYSCKRRVINSSIDTKEEIPCAPSHDTIERMMEMVCGYDNIKKQRIWAAI